MKNNIKLNPKDYNQFERELVFGYYHKKYKSPNLYAIIDEYQQFLNIQDSAKTFMLVIDKNKNSKIDFKLTIIAAKDFKPKQEKILFVFGLGKK